MENIPDVDGDNVNKSLFEKFEADREHIENEILEAQKRRSEIDEAYWNGCKSTMIRVYQFMGFEYKMK